ncbi:MAG: hypothetical protein HY646_14470 [Acidobacteria bacterium]|nr:hypothetical protein [Acidobacteriota bacterium]
MEDQTTHIAALKSTALVWTAFALLLCAGALVRLAAPPEPVPIPEKDTTVEQNSVVVQRVTDDSSEKAPAEPHRKPAPPTAVSEPVSQSEQLQPTAEASTAVPPHRDEQSQPDKTESVAETPASSALRTTIRATGLDELRAQIEAVRRQSDFRRKLGYYTEVGRSLPESQKRLARVEIQINQAYWLASTSFGMRFVFMATDFDPQSACLVFNVNSGTAEPLSAAILAQDDWVVRELIGDVEKLRDVRQNAAVRLGLGHSENLRVYSLIPERIWLAQLGKVADVLTRTRGLHLTDVSSVQVAYEDHGTDFDFVVKSIVTRDGREENLF